MKVYPEFKISADQLEAWQHDRAGAIVDVGLAKKCAEEVKLCNMPKVSLG